MTNPPEPSPDQPESSFPEARRQAWAEYEASLPPFPPPPPEGRILSVECIKALAACFETAEDALKWIQKDWKWAAQCPEIVSGSFNSDWRFHSQSLWAVWEAKKADVVGKKLFAEVKE